MNSPVNNQNSIESNAFVLVFERPFNKQELQYLLRLKDVLAGDLPSFKEINKLSVKLEGKSVSQTQEDGGFLLQSFKSDGKPSIVLKVEDNTIETVCFSYDNWQNVWGKVSNFFLEAISTIEDENNRLVICALKVVDKFLYGGISDPYNILDIFDDKTPYLTKKVLNGDTTRAWHIFQGWFEDVDTDRYLHNLNLMTADVNNKTETTIKHEIQQHFITNPQDLSSVKESLNIIFVTLHEKNKRLIRELLNQNQLKRIGL